MTKVFNKKNAAKLMAALIISGSIMASENTIKASADEVESVTTIKTETTSERTATKNGFVAENGKVYYYQNGQKIKGWLELDGKKYYLLNDYSQAKNMWRTINGKTYYFGADGDMVKGGFKEIDGKIYYFYSDGSVSSLKGGKVLECDFLNVRTSASSKAEVIEKINPGEKVLIREYSNGWYKVTTESWKTGWVSADYISIPGDAISQVIDVAMDQLGKPYKWGATGPNSFDCSGLMYYSFKQGANKTIPRTSSQQSTYGTKVTKSQLKPGDLVFFGSGSRVSHVGMYIGNDQYIHSPQTGDVVKISKLSDRTMITARRILN